MTLTPERRRAIEFGRVHPCGLSAGKLKTATPTASNFRGVEELVGFRRFLTAVGAARTGAIIWASVRAIFLGLLAPILGLKLS